MVFIAIQMTALFHMVQSMILPNIKKVIDERVFFPISCLQS